MSALKRKEKPRQRVNVSLKSNYIELLAVAMKNMKGSPDLNACLEYLIETAMIQLVQNEREIFRRDDLQIEHIWEIIDEDL